jgi:hypothetical protein
VKKGDRLTLGGILWALQRVCYSIRVSSLGYDEDAPQYKDWPLGYKTQVDGESGGLMSESYQTGIYYVFTPGSSFHMDGLVRFMVTRNQQWLTVSVYFPILESKSVVFCLSFVSIFSWQVVSVLYCCLLSCYCEAH